MTSISHPGAQLRSQFLSYFEKNGHHIAKSSPLVPQGDATLLFTNAGMVQFKDVFTGKETRAYKKASSSQKCVRAGGKHNDLENVGRTARHHTFFEMLGNFSFGDYFKEGAIELAWNFLTKDLAIAKDRLSVTIFEGDAQTPADEEAAAIWRKIGVADAKISRHSAKDNFWQMGDTGPCGPCTEIHFDRGVVKGAFGGDDPEGDRVLEIWNLVFMQFDRQADRSLVKLPAPSVDTGMGLERLAMVMNGCASNYDTDLLRPLIAFCEQAVGKAYTSTDSDDDVAMRVIADHARTTAFLVADGVLPGNVNREYVLRSIMRRAVRFGDKLGFKDRFFFDVATRAADLFAGHYPELVAARALIEKVAVNEEDGFRVTLGKGAKLFFDVAAKAAKADGLIPGDVVFDLKSTYGFPPDLTAQMAREAGLRIDDAGLLRAEQKHAEASSGELGLVAGGDVYKTLRAQHGATRFSGYDAHEGLSTVIAILTDTSEPTASVAAGARAMVLLGTTPFYGESGGQVGDVGSFAWAGGTATVLDTKKHSELHVHLVQVDTGTLKIGQAVTAAVDVDALERTRRNHSATHLLHLALRNVLGTHVTQKGSSVAPERLRFDYSHFEPMTSAQVDAVESQVNELILQNHGGDIGEMSFDDAKTKGAMALFGEKYGDHVRVVGFGPSVELCGGIHVRRTGDIGLFKITSEGPLASGVRRMEAVTGKGALAYVSHREQLLLQVARALKVATDDVPTRVEKLQDALKAAEKELARHQHNAQTAAAGDAANSARDINGVKLLTQKITDMDPKDLRGFADKLRDQLKSGVIVLGAVLPDDKLALLVAVTADLSGKLHAGKMVGELAALIGGKGGGKPDMAQAGGSDVTKLDAVFQKAAALVAAV